MASRRPLLLIAAIGLVATVLPPSSAANASVAPWTWKRVTQSVSVAANSSYTIRALCPSGYTAITGGLQLPYGSTLTPMGEYRQDDASGSGWTVQFRNNSASTGTATVVAECVESVDLPPISYTSQVFNRDGNGSASGEVGCPNAGEVVLTGGVDWSTGSSGKAITASAPGWGETSWFGAGYNYTSGAQLGVEVYCVNPTYVPGFQKVEFSRSSSGYWEDSLNCPTGKRVLNGGSLDAFNGSYPTLTKWTATYMRYSDLEPMTIRVMCIDAGAPTVSILGASPGVNGSYTSASTASFSFSGTDPAGYSNGFKCSLDGASPTACAANASFTSLTAGSHQLVVWNMTPDGRSSGAATYQWTVDPVAPTVPKVTVPNVTLAASATVKWVASDQGSSINHYIGQVDLIRADGTSTGWGQPVNWEALTSTSVKTPSLAPGESMCVAVAAIDQANNASPWSAPACTSRPLDDRAMTATAGWTRGTGSAYWQSTVSRATASNETLSRNNVHLSRVGVVATVCSGCGSVVVTVGPTQIGTISLDAASRANRKVKLLPAFGDRTGVVTLRSTTTGKEISIDGLVAMQMTAAGP